MNKVFSCFRAPYGFGVGKRAPYNFGVGKRIPYNWCIRYSPSYRYGVGKRSPYSFGDFWQYGWRQLGLMACPLPFCTFEAKAAVNTCVPPPLSLNFTAHVPPYVYYAQHP